MSDDPLLRRFTAENLQKLAELEELAGEILTDRQQIVELDRKRNSNREALSALRKEQQGGKSWVCFGNMFMKLPNTRTKEMILQDQNTVNEEIQTLRNNLKPKVEKLHELEGLPEVKGFTLTPLSENEMRATTVIK